MSESSQNNNINDNNDGQKKKKISRRKLISNVMIIAGLLLIIVPLVLTYINTKRNDDIIEEFLKEADQAVSDTSSLESEDVDSFYQEPVDLSQELNPEATSASPTPTASAAATPDGSSTPTPAPQPTKKPLMSKEEIGKRMTGVLIIDKIDLKMIIMDGVDDETLRVAAGRMPNTGKLDEIGNCVLAGHRSYTFGKYFNRLDELQEGDEIIIQTKQKTLKYTVYQKLIVEPNDFSITNRNDTDKILTLFTCHPVAIASHRLVIHAKQVE